MASIQTTKSGTYRVFYRFDGKPRSKSFTRKTDAQRFVKEVEVDLGRGDFVDPDRGKITLRCFVETRYLPAAMKRKSSQISDKRALGHILPVLGDQRLDNLEREPLTIQQYLKGKLDANLGPASVDKHFRLLKTIFYAAIEDERMRRNPMKKVQRPEVPDAEMRFLQPAEITTLAECINKRYRTWVYLAAYLGPRWSEAIGLRVGTDVDLLRSKITLTTQLLRDPDTKDWERAPLKTSGSKRSITMPDVLVELFAEHIGTYTDGQRGSLVFTTRNGTPVTNSSFRNNAFQPALKRAGLDPDIRIHDLRHTSVALAIARGAHPKAIQARLGHSTIKMTLDEYGHLFPELDEDLAVSLDLVMRDAMTIREVTPIRRVS